MIDRVLAFVRWILLFYPAPFLPSFHRIYLNSVSVDEGRFSEKEAVDLFENDGVRYFLIKSLVSE